MNSPTASTHQRRTWTFVEPLESRRLLTTTSVAVGNILFTAVASGTEPGGTDLFRSNLDGSDRMLLKHWESGTEGPHDLTGFHGQLFFGAQWTDYWSREFLWKSDGTTAGTVPVGNQPFLQYASYPHQFMIVNDHLLYLAQDNGHQDQIFATDGNAISQLISPPYGVGGYYGSFSHMHIIGNRLYAEVYNEWEDQSERWQTDGTLAGTRVADPFGLIEDGHLRVFGSTSKDSIHIDSTGRSTTVRINGRSQSFANSSFAGIFLNGLQGDDSISLGKRVRSDATINGNGGNDSIGSGSGNDQIDGGVGQDVIDGGAGDDSIVAGGGYFFDDSPETNSVHGGDGNDTIQGSSGQDFLFGDDGDDSVFGSYADDVIDGGAGNDSLDGDYGNDTVLGGAGDDTLLGDGYGGIFFIEENDSLVGDAGDDSIVGGFGDDTLVGGKGSDALDAGPGVDSLVSDAHDTIADAPPVALVRGVLCLSGTSGSDVLQIIQTGTTLSAVVNGQSSDLSGLSFHDLRIDGGGGNDTISLAKNLHARPYVFGGPGNDSIASAATENSLNGGAGNDTIVGGDGRDFIDGGTGSDSLDGGSDNGGLYGGDYLVYNTCTDALLKTDPAAMNIRTSVGETDSYHGFEVLECGSGNDQIIIDNPLDGIATIYGGAGDDRLTLRRHNPSMSVTDFAYVSGDEGDDTIAISVESAPGLGDVTYDGGSGDDTFVVENVRTRRSFNGSGGTDTVDYSAITFVSGISVSLDGERNDGPFEEDDVDYDISVVIGTAGNDTLTGGYGDETLLGGDGNDLIAGNQGNDSLDGGPGDDTLLGGAGDDTLIGGTGDDSIDGGSGTNQIIDEVLAPSPTPDRLLDELGL